ncbi:S8 family serine peptidase [Marinobacterium rhizophilum]|uniref:S8 family serine peptidase n=1 Tax=Marinobacterium rhizophilum TaxID=420402 RepID=UPI0003603E18|nr:S8 family serine peptidase [Marinobacterium rhizophilum]
MSYLAGVAMALYSLSNVAAAAPASSSPDVAQRVFIQYNPQRGAAVEQAIKHSQGVIHYRFDNLNTYAATLPAKAVEALKKRADVVLVEEDPKRYPMAQTTPYGIDMVQATDIWDANSDGLTDAGTVTGAGVQVCVIDSGIEADHDDLADTAIYGDTISDTSNVCGHGTHVAGTIAAAGNTLGVVGVSPGVSLYSVQVFSGSDCAWTYSSALINAAQRCAAEGSDIISMSLGGTFKSRTEEQAFQGLYDNDNVLSVAAAGNDGNTRKSYPASYASVISVAAIDADRNVASFSQQNDQVELAAPGVAVKSTVPTGTGTVETLEVNGTGYKALAMEGSPYATATGALVDCGIGENSCTDASGKVCLIQRGNITFADKVLACQAGGGVAAVIYNNEPGLLSGTLGGIDTSIPSLGISQADGQTLLGSSATASVTVGKGDYASWDGTSMATPHVAGVAALLMSAYPNATNADIRAAMQVTAFDLGPAGKDSATGYGLVQANDAMSALGGVPSSVNESPVAAFSISCTGLSCSFTNSSSDFEDDNNGIALSYEWDFGDGSVPVSQVSPSHDYGCSQAYTVMLTATDSDGASDLASEVVTPVGTACEIDSTAPTITNVESQSLKGNKFEITWTTNEPANSVVVIEGFAPFTDNALVTSHSMSFNGSRGATYTFHVESTDAAGNKTVDDVTYQHQN